MSECTNHAPALAYDYNSNRFILLYVQKADSGWQNRIIARTSTDGGFTWTPAQNLGISSIDTPGISCKPGTNECLMTYMLSNSDGQGIVRRRATVNSSTGVITLGDWGVNSNWIQRPPMAGYSTNYADWMLGMMHPSSEAMRANGQGVILTTRGSLMSDLFGSWSAGVASGVTLPANLITADVYQDDYMIYTAY